MSEAQRMEASLMNKYRNPSEMYNNLIQRSSSNFIKTQEEMPFRKTQSPSLEFQQKPYQFQSSLYKQTEPSYQQKQEYQYQGFRKNQSARSESNFEDTNDQLSKSFGVDKIPKNYEPQKLSDYRSSPNEKRSTGFTYRSPSSAGYYQQSSNLQSKNYTLHSSDQYLEQQEKLQKYQLQSRKLEQQMPPRYPERASMNFNLPSRQQLDREQLEKERFQDRTQNVQLGTKDLRREQHVQSQQTPYRSSLQSRDPVLYETPQYEQPKENQILQNQINDLQEQIRKLKSQNHDVQKQNQQFEQIAQENDMQMETILMELSDILSIFGHDFKLQISDRLRQVKSVHEKHQQQIQIIIDMLFKLKTDSKLYKIRQQNVRSQDNTGSPYRRTQQITESPQNVPQTQYLQTIKNIQEQNSSLHHQAKLLESKLQNITSQKDPYTQSFNSDQRQMEDFYQKRDYQENNYILRGARNDKLQEKKYMQYD